MSVAGLVLAAGGSRRMGRPKQLLDLGGRPLLAHVLDTAFAGGLGEVVVVLGAAADEIRAAVPFPPGARAVVNPAHSTGQASSLRAGLAALGDDVAAAVVLLADQPEVRPDAIRALVAAHAAGAPPAARARYGGRPGHPVLLGRALWPRLSSLAGDEGARAVLSAPGLVREVEVGGDPPPDVDTPQAYDALLVRWRASDHHGT